MRGRDLVTRVGALVLLATIVRCFPTRRYGPHHVSVLDTYGCVGGT